MGIYVSNIATPHRTLTERERRQLLKVTGERRDGYRDHILYSMALATGLREHELASLEVGDVFEADGTVKTRIVLRVFKRSSSAPTQQEVRWPSCPRTCAPSWRSSGVGKRGNAKASLRTRLSLRAIGARLYPPADMPRIRCVAATRGIRPPRELSCVASLGLLSLPPYR